MANPFSRGTLTKKLGPLPTWAWGIIAGVLGLGVFYYIKSRQAVKNAGSGLTVTSDDLTQALTGGGVNNTSNVPPATIPETNLTWLNKAVKYLTSGGANPIEAERALRLYLNGEPMTTKEGALTSKVITEYGLAPDGNLGTPSIIPDAPIPDKREGYYTKNNGVAQWTVITTKADGTKSSSVITDQESANAVNAQGVPFTYKTPTDYSSLTA